MRTWSLLQTLAADGHEITLVCFATPQEAAEDIRPLTDACRFVEIVIPQSSKQHVLPSKSERPTACACRPFTVWSRAIFVPKQCAARLQAIYQMGGFDAVFTETSYSLINFPVSHNIPVVLDNHNVEFVLLDHFARQAPSRFHRAYAKIESQRMRRWDKIACRRANLVLACSQQDRNLLRELYPAVNCAVVPNVIDVVRVTARHRIVMNRSSFTLAGWIGTQIATQSNSLLKKSYRTFADSCRELVSLLPGGIPPKSSGVSCRDSRAWNSPGRFRTCAS